MQRRSLLALSALIAAALAEPIISEKRQLPVVEGLVPIVGGLPVVVGIIGGSDGGLGGVGGLAGGKQATANDLPAAAPEIENKDLAKRKEALPLGLGVFEAYAPNLQPPWYLIAFYRSFRFRDSGNGFHSTMHHWCIAVCESKRRNRNEGVVMVRLDAITES
ncbi:hypothetical protein BKA70DRAFT_1216853 [Coprinopsis sp. MPI-PUGE-AT-0042]|nr:hypothetical protein BKA70DRAFT_1216853 [Coprinopsis sp. MPI-PUGE-AT-0042]